MAEKVSQDIENAVNEIVSTTDQSRNIRKELKKTIFETVGTLSTIFHNMKGILDDTTRQNNDMENKINTVKTELDACRSATAMGHADTSSIPEQELQRTGSRHVCMSVCMDGCMCMYVLCMCVCMYVCMHV
jgi:hypothetical protein